MMILNIQVAIVIGFLKLPIMHLQETGASTHDILCQTAPLLDSMVQRLNGYKLGDGEDPICDAYITEGWYSTGPYILARTNKGCGTTYPWYMNGSLPETGTENITVCKSTKTDACVIKKTLQAKRCPEDTFIFYLYRTPGCPEAYCIESITPGNITKGPPEIDVSPYISVIVDRPTHTKNELKFYCELGRQLDPQFYYTVKWYQSDGKNLLNMIWSSSPTKFSASFRDDTALSERTFSERGFGLGIRIVCTIAASHEMASSTGTARVSEDKFIGIELLNKSVTVTDATKTSVYLRLTVPFGCAEENTDCYLDTIVLIPKENYVCQASEVTHRLSNFDQKPCGVRFRSNEINTTKEFEIHAWIGENLERQKWLFKARLATLPEYTAHPIFANYHLDPLVVTLNTDGKYLSGKMCQSRNDPHMLSFDGWQFDHHTEGIFILYRHKTLPVQIQIQTKPCPNGVTCNCGVAVAAGRDVFSVNNCNEDVPRFKACEDGILKDLVHENSNNFEIYLPTGGRCQIVKGNGFFNVNIYPSPYDYGQSDGLCGDFDGNKYNEPQRRPEGTETDPILSWRVKENESLFQENVLLPAWNEIENLCSCNASGYTPVSVAHCHVSRVKHCERKDIQPTRLPCAVQQHQIRSPRDIYRLQHKAYDYHSDIKTSFRFEETNLYKPVLPNIKIRKRAVYDEVSAREDCINVLNTTAFRLCSTVPDIDVGPFIENCVIDAVMTNSMDWAPIHLEELKSQCKHQVYINQPLPPEITSNPSYVNTTTETERNSTNGNVSSSSSDAFTPEFLEEIESISCLYDCMGNGICRTGRCECNPGFGSFDCSVKLSDPPLMRGIPDRGLCDLRQRTCEKTSVFGDNFVASELLQCSLLPFQAKVHKNDASTIIEYGTSSDLRLAERLSFAEVSCPLDKHVLRKRAEESEIRDDFIARGYSISVANDGTNFGLPDSIVIFDSTCVNCTKDGSLISCTKHPAFCMRNGLCYETGESDGCHICGPSGGLNANWYESPDCQSLPIPSSKLWIIAAVLGPIGALLLFVLVLVFAWKWKGRKNVTKSSENKNSHDEPSAGYINCVYNTKKKTPESTGQCNLNDTHTEHVYDICK